VPGLPTPYVFVLNELRRELFVPFVDIGRKNFVLIETRNDQ
jgi:hypothetical protein